MRLPNAESAVIPPEKLRDYLLAPDHPRGWTKAVAFGRLGFHKENWPLLEEALRSQHLVLNAVEVPGNQFGRKFEIVAPLTGPSGGTAIITSVWIMPEGDPPDSSPLIRRIRDMKLKLLEVVALTRDLPEHGLRAGAIGTIVEVYGSTALEVEFTDESGNTLAVLTLSPTDIRKLRADELATLKTPATGP